MKAKTTLHCLGRLAGRGPSRSRLATAFLLGMLVQCAFVSASFANGSEETQASAEQAGTSQVSAALPDKGTPPAPASALGELATQELPAESAPLAATSLDAPSATDTIDDLAGVKLTIPPTASAPATEASLSSAALEPPTGFARSGSEVRELSVSPQSRPLMPEGRPAWVGAPPDLTNPRRHRLFVGSFPTSSRDELDTALDEPIVAAVVSYLDEEVLEERGAGKLAITADIIRGNLLDTSTEYVAELNTSTGPAYQKWVVLEITPEHRRYFVDAYRQLEQKNRMVALALGMTGIFTLTGVAHLAFNRRRRRYAETVQPVVHVLPAEPEPAAAKGSNRTVWLLAGSVASLFLIGLFFIGGSVLVYKDRAVPSVQVRSGSDATVSETPLHIRLPAPSVAAEVYSDPMIADAPTQKHARGDGVEPVSQVWDEDD